MMPSLLRPFLLTLSPYGSHVFTNTRTYDKKTLPSSGAGVLVRFVKKIANMPEARKVLQEVKDSVDALQSFFNEFEGMMDQISAMRGDSSPRMVVVRVPAREAAAPAAPRNVAALPGFKESGQVTMVDRVMVILRDQKRPMQTSEIVREYMRRNYPMPSNGKLYSAVNGALMYLFKRKKAIERTALRGGYFLRTNLSESHADKKLREVSA